MTSLIGHRFLLIPRDERRRLDMQWSSLMLGRGSPIPLYYQIAELIKEGVRTGELQSGEQLPSERDLSEFVAASRMTARHANAHLVLEGTLLAQHGRRTFVAEPKLTYDAFNLIGFTEEMMRRGGTVMSRVLEQTVVAPPARVASGLGLEPEATVNKIVRLRSVGDTPLLLETSYVPTELCPELEHKDLTAQCLYALLEHYYRLRLAYAEQTIEATIANDYESSLFGIPLGVAM
jgi:GntR family transcriptional regulator